MATIQEDIQSLKRERNAVILAHYYQTGDIQDIADKVGDSYALARQARDTNADVIVFCGVRFMAESAKILNPGKKVLLPVLDAGCPMAEMVTAKDVRALRAKYPDAAVACYVNSTADVKAESDVCVTSSNAVKVVASLPQKHVIFVPDRNLGRYVAEQLPQKEVILFSGYCVVHDRIDAKEAEKAMAAHPDALLLAHPECPEAVVRMAHYVGSTAGIIEYARRSDRKEFLIGTEMGVLHVLQKENPGKRFYLLTPRLICVNMKKTHIEDVRDALLYGQHEIEVAPDIRDKAFASLDRMLKI